MNEKKKEIPLVTVIIVTYQSSEYISQCIESLKRQVYTRYEIIVVDNGSTDNTQQIIKKYPEITFIGLKENMGYSRANNIGVKSAQGEYIALLNPDTEVHKDWLGELVKVLLKDTNIGIAVSKIYLGKTLFLDSAGSEYNQIFNAWSRGVFEKDKGQYEKEEEVPMGTPCAFLLRGEILRKTHLFDEDFFMYIEELDLCLRVRNLGYKITYVPTSIAYHYKSKSVEVQNLKPQFFKQYYANVNRAKVLGAYLSWSMIIRSLPLIILSYGYWFLHFFVSLQWGYLIKMAIYAPYFFYRGRKARRNNVLYKENGYQKYMRKMSLKELKMTINILTIKEKEYLAQNI